MVLKITLIMMSHYTYSKIGGNGSRKELSREKNEVTNEREVNV